MEKLVRSLIHFDTDILDSNMLFELKENTNIRYFDSNCWVQALNIEIAPDDDDHLYVWRDYGSTVFILLRL